MRADLKTLMDKLGVGFILLPYATCPWSSYNPDDGVTCSAEVRMNNDGDEVEAELQMVYENPPEGKPPIEQTIWLFFKPVAGDKWSTVHFRFRGNNEEGSVYNWEEKSCSFFASCVAEIKLGLIPDIDNIMEREMGDHERFGGSRQGGGSKAPKIKPQSVLGIKGGRGF